MTDAPKRIWKCVGCGVQMPSNCDCVANLAVSWEPEYTVALKGALRPETVSENIARDMQEGRFPECSEPQMVVDPSSALASSPEVAALIREAEAWGMERVAARARVYASNYEQSSDGRNTFILLAERADAEAAAIRARKETP